MVTGFFLPLLLLLEVISQLTKTRMIPQIICAENKNKNKNKNKHKQQTTNNKQQTTNNKKQSIMWYEKSQPSLSIKSWELCFCNRFTCYSWSGSHHTIIPYMETET